MSVGSGNGLSPIRRQAITWTKAVPVHWRIYAALGGDELMKCPSYEMLILLWWEIRMHIRCHQCFLCILVSVAIDFIYDVGPLSKRIFFNIYPCWGTSQISKQYNNLNYHSFGSNASWCLRVRCLIGCLNKCCRLGFKIYFCCSSLGPKKTRAVRMSQSWSNSYIQCDAFITWSILQNSHIIHPYMYQKTRPS